MESTANVYRRWTRTILLIVCISGISTVLAFCWMVYKSRLHMNRVRHVELLIMRLAKKRPSDVNEAQWANCLFWTWQLHTNYAHSSYFPTKEYDPFIAEFERHLNGPVTIKTIDAIWDDYMRHAPSARRYDRFRPTTAAALEAVEELKKQPYTEYSLDMWIDRLDRRERGLD
jgi:hypothetical protein